MVKSASEATDAYRRGIQNRMGGSGPYEDAARATTPEEAAETLQNARGRNISLDSMAQSYQDAYN